MGFEVMGRPKGAGIIFGRSVRWTEEEIEKLKALYDNALNEELLNSFRGRSLIAIRRKASSLDLRRNITFHRITLNENLKLSETEKAYIAGIIDGEGSITFEYCKTKHAPQPRVSISNTSLELIQKLKNMLNFGSIYKVMPKDKRGIIKSVKMRYEFVLTKFERIYSVLKAVYPFLIVKRKQAELMLEYLELRSKTEYKSIRDEKTGRILGIITLPLMRRELEIPDIIRKLNR